MPPPVIPIDPIKSDILTKKQYKRLGLDFIGFQEHQGADTFLQGPGDEVFISGFGLDSVDRAADGTLRSVPLAAPQGDVSDDEVRKTLPVRLITFPLTRAGSWPRTYTVTLLTVEEDNEAIAASLRKYEGEVLGALREKLESIPIVGGLLGDVVAGVAKDVYEQITDWLGNDAMPPQTVSVTLPHAGSMLMPLRPDWNGRAQHVDYGEDGARYTFLYRWVLE